MRLFVSEYICSGALVGDELPESLRREGAAMLRAVLADAAQTWTGDIVTTLDSRLSLVGGRGEAPPLNRVQIHRISEPGQERRLFETQAADAEATLIIAPESDRVLEERRRAVDAAGGRFLGSSAEAIALCADKLALAEHLKRHRIPSIETAPFEPSFSGGASPRAPAKGRPLNTQWTRRTRFPFPIVVKPRDGAGSQNTFRLTNADELQRAAETFAAAPHSAIWQPYVPGLACSVAAIVPDRSPHAPRGAMRHAERGVYDLAERQRIEMLPVAEQRLSTDGRFRYLRGRIPADFPPNARQAVHDLVRRTCETIPGLQGYIGFDIIVPEQTPDHPVIVEINPRLTTSYVGYRALAEQNLAERMLFPDRTFPPLTWKPGPVTFEPHDLTPCM